MLQRAGVVTCPFFIMLKEIKILDIDLDFFLNQRHTGVTTSLKRLGTYYKRWKKSDVKRFIENNCGLNKINKVKGRYFIHHDEVFYFLRELQEQNDFRLRFSIDHVDAHADLGLGDASYKYIFTDILSRPIKDRCYNLKTNGWEGLSAGNFLAFGIAARWISSINYISNPDWREDIQWLLFREYNPATNIIELKHYTAEQIEALILKMSFDPSKFPAPMALEPPVHFNVIDYSMFTNNEPYDYVFLTQSPGFTPRKSDELIPVILDYIDLIE